MRRRIARELHIDRAIRGKRDVRAREIDVDRDICRQRRSRELWVAVVDLAGRQHGVVARDQLRTIGIPDDVIDRWIKARRLHPLHRGVYAIGHRVVSREGRYLAAVLAAGEGAALSHCAAADLWELRATKEDEIDVTVAADRRGDSELRIHRDALAPNEVMRRNGIRVTKPLRTILDLAGCIPQHELERAIRQAVYRRLTTTALLADAVARHAGRRGMKPLRETLVHLGEAPGLSRSDLEDEFLRFLRRHRLPLPELNVKLRVGGRRIEADCMWKEQRVIVELDGRDAHDSTPAFESDRARDSALVAAGWRVIRVTETRMHHDGRRLARETRALVR
jgi:very-short-patch-repair endonuclease